MISHAAANLGAVDLKCENGRKDVKMASKQSGREM